MGNSMARLLRLHLDFLEIRLGFHIGLPGQCNDPGVRAEGPTDAAPKSHSLEKIFHEHFQPKAVTAMIKVIHKFNEPWTRELMGTFRIFLGVIFISIVLYTTIVGSMHGWDLLPVFLGDVKAMTWSGQFNFDFMGFLLLSGIWVSWRHQFSPGGLALGLVAVFGGIMFLSLYLLIVSYAAKGDITTLLMGKLRVVS